MKHIIFASIIITLLLLGGCSLFTPKTQASISQLTLNQEDQKTLAIIQEGCNIEAFEVRDQPALTEYGMCNYTTTDNTEIIIELTKYQNLNDLNGSYEYNSLHLINSEWQLSENTFGDQSRLQRWTEGETTYYHLWITKNNYLIHITSKGSDIQEIIENIGEIITKKIAD